MPKKSLEQRISELISTYGLDAIQRCVQMAAELSRPRPAKQPRKKAAAATPPKESAA